MDDELVDRSAADGGVVVRRVGVDEADLAARLRLRFLADLRGVEVTAFRPDFVAATHDFLAEHLAAGTVRAWVADADGQGIGTVAVVVSDLPPKPEDLRTGQAHVLNLWVDPAHRRRGLGRLLLGTVEADAAATGVRALVLHTTEDGRALYDAAGFEPDERWRERVVP